jgi:hypothetical protein
MTELKPSVRATYDGRETGPRYWVTTTVDGKPLSFRTPIEDPFVRQTVAVGWRDLLRNVLRRRSLVVEVTVGAGIEAMHDVLELDENTLITGRTRKAAFQQSMHSRLAQLIPQEET